MQIVIVLIGISFITFALTFMSPGDPVRNMYTATGVMPTEEMVQETRQELGLNDPFLTQYTRWLGNCLKGDFGKSYSLNKPVTELLAGRLWPTLKLTLMSMILMVIISVPLGMLSAVYKDRWIDYLIRGITFLGCAMPNFWVGLLLMLHSAFISTHFRLSALREISRAFFFRLLRWRLPCPRSIRDRSGLRCWMN